MNLITLNEPQSADAEAYRSLRTNLYFAGLDTPAKSVVITSAVADEERTAVLANLAVVTAQTGKKVIAVDADLRHPALHEYFDVENERGLGDILSDEDPGSPIPLLSTGVRNLSVLTSGSAHSAPLDLLSSNRMVELITQLNGMADAVFYSAAPMLDVSDTAILASRTDGVLLVVYIGRTRRAHAQQAKEMLARAHARLIGVVTLDTAKKHLLV